MLKKCLDELREMDQREKDYKKKGKKYERMRLKVARNLYPHINYVCKALARSAKWHYTHNSKDFFTIWFYSSGYDSASVSIEVDRTEDFIFISIHGEGDVSYESTLSLEEFSEDKLAEKIMEAYRGKR